MGWTYHFYIRCWLGTQPSYLEQQTPCRPSSGPGSFPGSSPVEDGCSMSCFPVAGARNGVQLTPSSLATMLQWSTGITSAKRNEVMSNRQMKQFCITHRIGTELCIDHSGYKKCQHFQNKNRTATMYIGNNSSSPPRPQKWVEHQTRLWVIIAKQGMIDIVIIRYQIIVSNFTYVSLSHTTCNPLIESCSDYAPHTL